MYFVVLKRTVTKRRRRYLRNRERSPRGRRLFRTSVLGHGLRTLANGVLREFTGKQETNGRLDLAARNRRPLVVMSETGRFRRDPLEYVVDETVHDAHRLTGYAGIRVNLLQHLVDVDGVTFLTTTLLPLIALGDVLLGLPGLLGGFTTCFRRHGD